MTVSGGNVQHELGSSRESVSNSEKRPLSGDKCPDGICADAGDQWPPSPPSSPCRALPIGSVGLSVGLSPGSAFDTTVWCLSSPSTSAES